MEALEILEAFWIPWGGGGRPTADESDAYYRRNIVISFPNKFEGEKDDPGLLAKLTTEEELSGIFNMLMTVSRRLFGTGIFVNEKTIQFRREKYEMAANPIGSFIENATAKDAVVSDKITKDEFYQAYKRYCEKNTVAVESKENFGKILKKQYGYEEGREASGKRRTIWKGVRLVEEYYRSEGDGAGGDDPRQQQKEEGEETTVAATT